MDRTVTQTQLFNRFRILKVKCDSCRLWICPNCISMELYDPYKEFKCQKVRFQQMA